MLKKIMVIALLGFFWPIFPQSALERLTTQAVDDIVPLLQSPNPVVAAVEFSNYSFLSDLEAQTFYQLLSVKLERSGKLIYRDLMVDLTAGRGKFNFSDLSRIRYGLQLVLLNHPRGLSFSAAVRLVESSELLGVVYRTEEISPTELWAVTLLGDTSAPAELILKKTDSFRIDNSVFHVAQDTAENPGKNDLYALTPEHLIVWHGMSPNQNSGEKIPIKWFPPRTPSIQNEGKITFFSADGERFMAIGANFAPGGMVVKTVNQGELTVKKVPFVPVAASVIGDVPCLIGSRYVPGTNIFDGLIQFMSLASLKTDGKENAGVARKQMTPLFDMALVKREDGRIRSFFAVDEKYRLVMSDAEWNALLDLSAEHPTCGANMTLVNGKWLVTSAAENKNDALKLYFVGDGGLRYVGDQMLEGRIHSMSEGRYSGNTGLWVLRHTSDQFGLRTTWLDFWMVAKDEN